MPGVSCSTTLERKSENHLAQLITNHTKNLKAFLKTNVFLKLKNANENEQLCHPELDSGSLKETEILNINKSCKTEQSTFQNDNAKAAFTLAEVLITLGIIGVVAALTLPTLIANYQEKALETQYKKAKTILANGYKLMMAKNEVFDVKYLPLWECYTNGSVHYECANKHHKEYFKMVQSNTYDETPWANTEYSILGQSKKFRPFNDHNYIFSTADGIIYELYDVSEDYSSFSIIVDVNGPKNPNTVKKDLYKFNYSSSGKLSDVTEDFTSCTVDNPSGCTTEEACRALPSDVDVDYKYCIYWYSDRGCVKGDCPV